LRRVASTSGSVVILAATALMRLNASPDRAGFPFIRAATRPWQKERSTKPGRFDAPRTLLRIVNRDRDRVG
jgi:hypothetical protein